VTGTVAYEDQYSASKTAKNNFPPHRRLRDSQEVADCKSGNLADGQQQHREIISYQCLLTIMTFEDQHFQQINLAWRRALDTPPKPTAEPPTGGRID